ncbi:hypothetical protein B0H21DRAFT_892350 [Amylocystis lapponica]|nr:hypothetical protein B0H21DRAFT_892350 [Amylocystis lapponica]
MRTSVASAVALLAAAAPAFVASHPISQSLNKRIDSPYAHIYSGHYKFGRDYELPTPPPLPTISALPTLPAIPTLPALPVPTLPAAPALPTAPAPAPGAWRQYGQDWKQWGQNVGQQYKSEYGRDAQPATPADWKQYGQDWKQWGQSVGDYYSAKYGYARAGRSSLLLCRGATVLTGRIRRRDSELAARTNWAQYGDAWDQWGEHVGDYYSAKYGRDAGLAARTNWEQYGDAWDQWGENVGNYYDSIYGYVSPRSSYCRRAAFSRANCPFCVFIFSRAPVAQAPFSALDLVHAARLSPAYASASASAGRALNELD